MKKIILTSSFILLSACSKSFEATQVEVQLQKPIGANQTAKNYADWHSSKNNPDQVFSDLIVKYMAKDLTSEEICQGFENLSAVDLTLYENNIRQKETGFILKSCQKELIKKLENHWNQERLELNLPQEKTSVDVSAFSGLGTGLAAGKTDAIVPDVKIQKDVPSVRRFEKVVMVERDVSEGYYAITGDLENGQVALTFDDGPHAIYTKDILKALDDANVKATFFVMGNSVRKNPEELRAIAKAGHAIGTHSQTHRCQAANARCEANNGGHRLTYAEALKDITMGHQAVKDVVGWVYPFFRFPYGESSIELKELLRKTGVGEFFWSVDSDDWRTYKKDSKIPYSSSDMIESVMAQIKSRKRGHVLFHDIQKKTAVALPALLNRLYDEGYQPVMFVPKDKSSIQNSKLLALSKPKK